MIFIQIFIILIVLIYAWHGYRKGFLSQLLDIIGLVASFLIAIRWYSAAGAYLEGLGVNKAISNPAGFFALWILFQIIFYLLSLLILRFIPPSVQANKVNRFLGIIPGFLKGLLIISIVLMMFLIVPLVPAFKDDLMKGPVSGYLLRSTTKIDNQVEKIFGGVNTLTFLSPKVENEESTNLSFKATTLDIDEDSEEFMLEAVNRERARLGLKKLKLDEKIREVARQHSIDMAKNGYFSHTDLGGKSPADRMEVGGVKYLLAGENIALTPTWELAQIGFMNSPKHRDNILDPQFGRIGIGIINLGSYGRMTTQNFAD